MWSDYQKAIFDFPFESSLMVEAVAGSGKTTTCVELVKRLSGSVLFVAFNKHIADELQRRGVPARTLNGFGNSVVRENLGWTKLDAQKTLGILQWGVVGYKYADDATKKLFWKTRKAIVKIIGLCKADLTAPTEEIVNAICEKHAIELDERALPWVYTCWHRGLASRTIDFDDQIFLPVWNNWSLPLYDFVIVDEAQDLNVAQIELVARIGKRVIAVGDSWQAIYGFRGADPESMNKLATRIGCTRLPLSICYRCGKNIVAEAQKLGVNIEASSAAEDGIVRTADKLEAVDGDFVLCRTTAPIVSACLKMIEAGVRATILGREIGDDLADMLGDGDLKVRLAEIDAEVSEKVERLLARGLDMEAEALRDKVSCIHALATGCSTVNEVRLRVTKLFSETTGGVVFATVHKSKGLEGDRVWILRPDLLPHPAAKKDWQQKQERHLRYVAVTRAKKELIYVSPDTSKG